MEHFAPLTATIGGVLIGLAATILWAFNGRLAGISTIAGNVVPLRRGDTLWRIVFLVGLPIGAWLGFVYGPHLFAEIPATLPAVGLGPLGLVSAGLLVGIGTRLGERLHLRPRHLRPVAPVASLVRRRRHLHGQRRRHRLHREARASDEPDTTRSYRCARQRRHLRRRAGARPHDRSRRRSRTSSTSPPSPPAAGTRASPSSWAAACSSSSSGSASNRLIRKPIAAPAFSYPDKTRLDRPLVVGSVLFGIGWGAAGFCPGPAIANLGADAGRAPSSSSCAMLAGSWLVGALRIRTWSRPRVPSADTPRA